jgi:hypothetical protein
LSSHQTPGKGCKNQEAREIRGPSDNELELDGGANKPVNYIRRIFFSLLIIIDMYKHVVAFLVLITISLAACPATGNINNLLAGIFEC